MKIELTAAQTHHLLDWAAERARRHAQADCEPPGYELVIAVSSLGAMAHARSGQARLDLGDVVLELDEPGQSAAAGG